MKGLICITGSYGALGVGLFVEEDIKKSPLIFDISSDQSITILMSNSDELRNFVEECTAF